MKNRFIKTLSVIGMSALLLVNGGVLFETYAYDDNQSNEKDHRCENTPDTGADGDHDFAFQPGMRTQNVTCIKEISITGAGGGTTKFGFRDKCKKRGSGCRPTKCI